jgi:hypothetical protein
MTGALVMTGCSRAAGPEAAAPPATSSGAADSITLIRETQFEFPDKRVAAMREMQKSCLEGRAVVAAAQGWTFDPAAESQSDAEILALDAQRTEEYFDGPRYAKVVSGRRLLPNSISVEREGSCKFKSQAHKTVEIRVDHCSLISVAYDLEKGGGTRTELKDVCDAKQEKAQQVGDPVPVPGTSAQCRWSVDIQQPVAGLQVPVCTLVPQPVHAGTGRALVALRGMTDVVRQSTKALPGTNQLTLQSMSTVERAVQIAVGTAISPDRFKAPADSANFAPAN